MNPLLPGGNSQKNWRHINGLLAATERRAFDALRLNQNLSDLQRRPPDLSDVWHPFKLYQFPSIFRDDADPDTDWTKFRVRNGAVIIATATADTNTIAGTDGVDFPDEPGYGDDTITDITVDPGTETWWFWLTLYYDSDKNLQARVQNGSEPADVTLGTPDDNPWTTWPKFDGYHFPIGYVDTLTDQDTNTAHVRQLLRTDLYLPSMDFAACQAGVRKVYSIPAVPQGNPT